MTREKMNAHKRIALVAHDNQKNDLVLWCVKNRDKLEKHELCGTGTTSKLIADATGLPIKAYKSGPLGGDQQIGAELRKEKSICSYSSGIRSKHSLTTRI